MTGLPKLMLGVAIVMCTCDSCLTRVVDGILWLFERSFFTMLLVTLLGIDTIQRGWCGRFGEEQYVLSSRVVLRIDSDNAVVSCRQGEEG
jgi:hypothetical protein